VAGVIPGGSFLSSVRQAGRRAGVVAAAIVECSVTADPARAQDARDIAGTVVDVADGAPLQGVIVQVRGAGHSTVTDDAGAFVLRGVPGRRVLLLVSRIGIYPDSLWVEDDQSVVQVVVALRPIALPGITARARLPARVEFEESVQPSIVRVDRETIAQLPAAIEADVVRAVQLLPGTIALNDYTVGFNVRGGEPDQNLTQLDGITIFNPSHLGGLFSTFDTDAVDEVQFITGAFPAASSGRLSSVMDVGIRPGRRDRFGVRGGVSLLSSRLLLEGPIGGKGASWLVSARRTYADVLASALTSETLPYYFWDTMAKLAIPVGAGGTLSATGYLGRDVIDWVWTEAAAGQPEVRLDGGWGNHVVGVRYDQPVGPHRLILDAGASGFSTAFGLRPGILDAENTARLLSGSARLQLTAHRDHAVTVGAAVESYRMQYDAGSESFGSSFLRLRYAPVVWSGFGEDEWRVSDRLIVRPGLRVEGVQGPDVVRFSPRIGAKYFVTPSVALTGSAGRYHQVIHSLRDQNLPWNIFDLWIGADSATPVASSTHLVGGIEWWFGAAESVSLEVYRKTFTDIIDANLDEDPGVQGDEILAVSGDAWGFDLLVRRHWGRLSGWVAYSFTKAIRETPGGRVYPAVHDRRHMVNVVLQAPGPFGSDAGVRLGIGSPLPYTPFIGEWNHRFYRAATHTFDNLDREPIASPDLNSARFPMYGRIDVSLRWELRRFGGILRPYVQVANVLNRRNVFLYFYDYTTAPATRTAFSQLPVLPSVGVEFAF
jgi:hypothetical protein